MEDQALPSLFYWDIRSLQVLVADMAIILLLFASARFITGFISRVNSTRELIKKDNPAFAISFAGVVTGVTIVLTGAMYGNPVYTITDSVLTVATYGLLGIVLMALTRIIFDKIVLPHVLLKEDISKGNLAAAFVDAGSVIGTAIVIRTVMVWVNPNSVEGVGAVLAAYLLSQLLLSAASFARIRWYRFRHQGQSLEELIRKGNTAFALKFMGRTIGTAFVIAGASHFLLFEIHSLFSLLPAWAGIAVIAMVGLSALSWLADRIILPRIDIQDEIINQKNIALGAVQCAIYIALGLLLGELMV